MRYYLVTDEGTQWFQKLVAKDADGHIASQIDIPNHLGGDFLTNIYSREPSEVTIRIDGMSFGGWNVSEVEYNRIRRMIELWPAVREFEKLQAYNI